MKVTYKNNLFDIVMNEDENGNNNLSNSINHSLKSYEPNKLLL
jgi:hypothetical protein